MGTGVPIMLGRPIGRLVENCHTVSDLAGERNSKGKEKRVGWGGVKELEGTRTGSMDFLGSEIVELVVVGGRKEATCADIQESQKVQALRAPTTSGSPPCLMNTLISIICEGRGAGRNTCDSIHSLIAENTPAIDGPVVA
jgi:hypothetical protein